MLSCNGQTSGAQRFFARLIQRVGFAPIRWRFPIQRDERRPILPLGLGLLVRPAVCDPLADNAVQRAVRAATIVYAQRHAVVIPELELG